MQIQVLAVLALFPGSNAFFHQPSWIGASTKIRFALEAKVGTIFGSSSGSTEEVADMIVEALGTDVASTPLNIDDVAGNLAETFAKFDCLVVGTPTYNTDADKQRSATSWDGVYYDELATLASTGALKGKPVAVFGLGDQEGYADNFADGCGELHDVFEAAGCTMFGYTSAVDGTYEHEGSKTQRGEQFVALVCDNANQPELSERRVARWVDQLKQDGFLTGGGSPVVASAAAPLPVAPVADPSASQAASAIAAYASGPASEFDHCVGAKVWLTAPIAECAVEGGEAGGFVPFHSPLMKQTLWLSTKDHRLSYYEFEGKKK